MMTAWKKEITDNMILHNETWHDVIANTLTEEELNRPFNNEWGGTSGVPFTLWTTARVYFPVQHDGSEWCGSVARNPNGKPTNHFGMDKF